MKISVVIPTLNEEGSIGACLKSLIKQSYENSDIIVVDANSSDRTREIAGEYTENIITADVKSPGIARNMGVKNSDADIVAFIDADTTAPGNWLETIAENFEKYPGLIALGGVLKPRDPRPIDTFVFKITSDLWYRFTAIFGIYQLGTPNCAYKRDVFLKAGGFDESLSMLEDTELSIRISKYGKVRIDKNLYTYNSARRFVQEGYHTVFFRYVRAYFDLFVLRRGVKLRHFDTIEHD